MNSSNKPRPDSKAKNFSTPESFGLFMDALRELQFYEDETARIQPSHEKLNAHLDEALESLETCYRSFPKDILPRYYLATALTMMNQRLFAKTLKDCSDKFSNVPGLHPSQLKTELENRKWPLLDRAIGLLKDLLRSEIHELGNSTKFNLANMYANRDANGDLDKALNILPHFHKPTAFGSQSFWTRVGESLLRETKQKEKARAGTYQENLGIYYQAQLLKHWINARSILKLVSNTRPTAEDLKNDLVNICGEVDKSEELEPRIRIDLLTDAETKLGFLDYSVAFNQIENLRLLSLDNAEKHLLSALQYKPNWNPAQIYLAMVYQAQGNWDKANTELTAVLGNNRIPTATIPDKTIVNPNPAA